MTPLPSFSGSDMPDVLAKAQVHVTDFLNGLADRPVAATTDTPTLRARLSAPLPLAGQPAGQVIDDLVAATRGGHLGSAGGRFFGRVIGGALPSQQAADWLISTWDNNAAIHDCGPASAVVDEVASAWIKELLDLPDEASFAFTSGCQMSHATCLAAARHALLRDAGWDVEARGLNGAPALRILATDQIHRSIGRALRLLGLGTDCITLLPTGADGRLMPETLEAALTGPRHPTTLVLDAGDLNLGTIAPFDRLIPLARASGAWVHIDGAFALWGRASARYRLQLAGLDLADSWASDAYKWLTMPKDIGVAFVRNRDAPRAALAVTAAYIDGSMDNRDQINWTPEWTRRAGGLTVYAALRELGRDRVEALIRPLLRPCGGAGRPHRRAGQGCGGRGPSHAEPGAGALPRAWGRCHACRSRRLHRCGNMGRAAQDAHQSVVNARTTRRDVELTVAAVARVLKTPRA